MTNCKECKSDKICTDETVKNSATADGYIYSASVCVLARTHSDMIRVKSASTDNTAMLCTTHGFEYKFTPHVLLHHLSCSLSVVFRFFYHAGSSFAMYFESPRSVYI